MGLLVYTGITQFIKYITFFNLLLIDFAIIFVKSSEDVIQRISKLDFLTKVSIFQKNRLQLIAEHEQQILPAFSP